MKDFKRDNMRFSLCGLNCGLCSMHLNGYCPGCGGGAGNQSCKIAKCSMQRQNISYCFECGEYPCKEYEHIDAFDSFITHRNQIADMEKAKSTGIEVYNAEQKEKRIILDELLANYNDGRKKTLFCVAVNLLDLHTLKRIMQEVNEKGKLINAPLKDKAAAVTKLLQAEAEQMQVELKLRKKSK